MRNRIVTVVLSALLSAAPHLQAQKIKVIVDQDARGPGTSDQQAILVFLQAPEKFDVLGITTVSGDQWVKEETQHVLRLLEIANRIDVPVIQGARRTMRAASGSNHQLNSRRASIAPGSMAPLSA